MNKFDTLFESIISETLVLKIQEPDENNIKWLHKADLLAAEASGDNEVEPAAALLERCIKHGSKVCLLEAGFDIVAACEVHEYNDKTQAERGGYENALCIGTLAVYPEFQGKGYGYKFLSLLFPRLFELYDGLPITLGVVDSNIKAKSLYEKLGMKLLYEVDEQGQKCCCYGLTKDELKF